MNKPPSPQDQDPKVARATVTKPGIVMGTPPYMSPEQLRGEPADTRSDIFSFGCVLYEMLTGDSPFYRDSVADTMAAILKDTPTKLSEAGKEVPEEFEQLILRCLSKNREDRFPSAHDLGMALKAASNNFRTSIPSNKISSQQTLAM